MEQLSFNFNINVTKDTDYAYVHYTRKEAKVCVHFPRLKVDERIERYDTYKEAEEVALKYNAEKNDINEKEIFLVTVDTSTYPLDENNTAGVITGCFSIKNIDGEVVDTVLYEPTERIVSKINKLSLTDVAEITTAIYMFKYLRKNDYKNVIVNYDNIMIKKVLTGNINEYSKKEQELIRKLRGAVNGMRGKVIFQHLKSHTGHKNLDDVDKLAKKTNKQFYDTMKKEYI